MRNFILILGFLCTASLAQEQAQPFSASTFSGLKLRNIGPAMQSGRIADIAIDPHDPNYWYVATASGGVWKTVNAGTTWTPVFDRQGSYSIGCVTIDPNNPHTIWVGTGENVGGRHVGFGDGIYRSDDDGKTWKNMGLKNSEHISKILVRPGQSRVIYVAAQGPLWSPGGDRGLYRTGDGGTTWTKILGGNEWTGVTDLVMDPGEPDILYAATWQRHRTVAAYMGGGPGSGIHRSTDGGETWEKLTEGIPTSNLGKIGLALSPFDTDVLYAAIETDRRTGGIYISRDRGSSWTKQSSEVSGGTGPHYYQELVASPHQKGRLYLMSNTVRISDDQGKTFQDMNEDAKHGDSHSLTFREGDPNYLLFGTDGGIYESFDLSKTWRYVSNLPVSQYYKLAVDDSEPFYYIYGGAQDNGTQGGLSATDDAAGIRNSDWFNILGADGYSTATEPGNPGIVYAETQEGGIHRIDRITGEQVFIQPQAGEGEPNERFNWDAPILVSPFDPARIYTASYRVWRSDDRGDSWTAISGDLCRTRDRFALPIMGKEQSWDNPWDVLAMSNFNTITSLSESPLTEGLIYAGTDDGIIQVTEDGGKSWRKTEAGSMKGIPGKAFVNDIRADLFDANTVYAALDNHKEGDFRPYLLKSTDRGRTWTSIAGNLPERTIVWRLVQDHVKKELLFAATEFGIFFTVDGGTEWIQLKGGVPTIAFRDITIQRRENDLVAASFGRGFFLLDDISPLRMASKDLLKEQAVLFPVKDPLRYIQRRTLHSQGNTEFLSENPPFGAVFTYYLKEDLKSLKEKRKEKEKKLDKEADVPFPGWDALESERDEEAPYILFTIKDGDGAIVNNVRAPAKKGFHRVSWDLRHALAVPAGENPSGGFRGPRGGIMVTPGDFSVSMYAVQQGKVTRLAGEEYFRVRDLRDGALQSKSPEEFESFRLELEAFQKSIGGVRADLAKAEKKIAVMKAASLTADSGTKELMERVYAAESLVQDLKRRMFGYGSRGEVGEKDPPTPLERMQVASRGSRSTYGPTATHLQSLEIGMKELAPISVEVKRLTGEVLPALARDLIAAGAALAEDE